MVKKLLYTVIPFFICLIISLVNYNREIKLDNLYNVSGMVAEYIPPRGGVRTVNTSMAVVINDTKYKVSDGVRWASNIKVL